MNGHSTLQLVGRRYSIADIGSENPLPTLGAPGDQPYRITGDLPQEIIDGSQYGYPANLYPYRLQDGYGRSRSDRELQTVVLENERLRATFLPQLGGRLWELFDKQTGKHLLHTPHSIQLGNLALRSAWFAGGIEWNIGTRGHSPSTCSPLHASRVRTPDGHEVLRLWEFDRLREVVFQIDAWLPRDSAVLLVAVRIRNPNTLSVPMYWWTNAAVPEDVHSRIIAPANSAFASDDENGLARVSPTDIDGIDATWPTNNRRARDFFFDLPPDNRRWILNADADGDGLAMLSTKRLRGRKLFVWGQGPGGHRWQQWLGADGGRYAEIQSGLAQTQFQHLPMPGRADWFWLEAYGNARVDTDIAHGADWAAAVAHCESRVDALAGTHWLDEAHAVARGWADVPPTRSLVLGSGWGALESARRRRGGHPWLDETGTPFPPESITDDQRPWLELLDGSRFPGADTFVAGKDWEERLAAEPAEGHLLDHLAAMKHARGHLNEARQLYLHSLRLAAGAAAHRGLAMIALTSGFVADGLEHYLAACSIDPCNVSLLGEAATACLNTGAANEAMRLIERSEGHAMRHGRIRFLHALALARTGNRERAACMLRAGIEVPDLREGENSLSALWLEVCPGEEVPAEYQFGMAEQHSPGTRQHDGI